MSKIDIDRLREDLKSVFTAEILISHYMPDVDILSAKTGDEYRVKCCLPGHNDDTPSLFINSNKFVYNCKGKCDQSICSGDFIKFIQVMDSCGFVDALKKACHLCGMSFSMYESNSETKPSETRPPISKSVVEEFHNRLLQNNDKLSEFCQIRNLTKNDIIYYKIGVDKKGNYTLPIYNKYGGIATIKFRHRKQNQPKTAPKYWYYKIPRVKNPSPRKKSDWWRYGDTCLFEIDKLCNIKDKNSTKIIITGGEFDAIQINRFRRSDILAVSSTSGEGSWDKSWNKLLDGFDVYVCFDNDDTGRIKSRDIAKKLKCKVIDISKFVPEKGDITDFFKSGKTIDDFIKLANSCRSFESFNRQDIINSLTGTSVKSVNPAFFIDNDIVYITAMFEREKEIEINDNVVKYKTNEPMIISSDGNIYEIPRISHEIKKRDPFAVATFKGFTVKQEPTTAQTKWSGADAIAFLKGEYKDIDIKEIFKDIYFSIKRYSKFARKTYRGLVALYIMGSYFYEGFQSYPYLHLHGEKGSGKSTLGRVIAALSFNGDFVVNPTVAVVARSIQEQKGLVVFDEVEQQSQRAQGRSEMGQIFNSGYQRGAKRPVCDPDNKNKRLDFDLYCPKVICNIFGLNDTTKNRCITIRMQKIDRASKIKDPQTDPDLLNISKMMYEIMMRKTREVLAAYEEVKSMEEFSLIDDDSGFKPLIVYGRERELYTPIFTMAKFIYNESGFAEPWNRLIYEFCYISEEKRQDEEDTPEEILRTALKDVLIEKDVDSIEMSTYDLVVAYKGMYVESPGNQVEHWIGKTLRKLDLCEPATKRKTVTISYTNSDGKYITERKKLKVFTITRERLRLPPVELAEKDIPF